MFFILFFVKVYSFEINTINRSFIVDIVLLDGNNQPLYNFSFDVPVSGTGNQKRNF
jgi:hypothetical protein